MDSAGGNEKGFRIRRSRSKEHDIFGGDLFVLIGHRKDRCKVLFWQRGGYVLYYKRLDRGRFKLPQSSDEQVEMTSTDLSMLLEGIDFSRVRKPAALEASADK